MKLFDNRTRVAARVRRVIDHTDYPSGLRRRENLGQHGGRIDPWKLVLFALPVEIVLDHVHPHEIEAVARKRSRVRRADERSAGRRAGKEGLRTWRSRWAPNH